VNSRISLTNNSFKILKAHNIYRALIVYVNDDDSIWRLSLLTALPIFDSTGKVVISYSNPRRHSYVLGSDVGIATARKYLGNMGPITDFENLQLRFSVEAVNKDFYKEISGHFYKLVGLYTNENKLVIPPVLKLPVNKSLPQDLQNYAVRLLGRIIFIWFLKQKSSAEGVSLLPIQFNSLENLDKKNILNDIIEPIFFEVLNKPNSKRDIKFQNGKYSLVPYLNGGLFQPSEGDSGDFYDKTTKKSKIYIPNSWFDDLFTTLSTYNFTIDENLENDIDLSIDPEMLGRVFENLLAEINPETGQIARRSTGSYYTPRAIVNFMVDETLVTFIRDKTSIDVAKIRALITTSKIDDLNFPLNKSEISKVILAIKELKAIDPACGSGAFPLGVLQKLLWIITQIDPLGEEYLDSNDLEGTEHWLSQDRVTYLIKRKLIRDVIFGIDIQSIAVEIAKLRCFLTLMVDQEIHDNVPNRGIVPLPNLDFKFICADSLTKLNEDKQMLLGDDLNLETKLNELRKKYFATTNSEKKSKLQSAYEELTNTNPKLFGESKRNYQLKSFKPLTSNNQSLFFDSKIMFGFEKFDIVIGNPPYIDYRKISPLTKEELKSYEVAKTSRMINLYIYFFELGLSLLNNTGVLAYISPQQYLVYQNTNGLRDLIRERSLILLADFARVRIFDAATYTFVSIISNKKSSEFGRYQEFNQINDFESPVREMEIKNPIPEPLNFSEFGQLLFKIENLSSSKLGDNADIFCASSSALITSNDSKTGPILVEASNIFEWKISNTREFVDKSSYSSNSARKQNSIRIITTRMTKTIRATVVKDSKYLGGKINVLLPNELKLVYFFTALLNSKLVNFWYRERFSMQHMQGGALPVNTTELTQVPMPKLHKNLWDKLSKLSLEALTSSDENLDILKQKIDDLIFELYELTDEEKGTVVTQFASY
jgi:hypothetical protein